MPIYSTGTDALLGPGDLDASNPCAGSGYLTPSAFLPPLSAEEFYERVVSQVDKYRLAVDGVDITNGLGSLNGVGDIAGASRQIPYGTDAPLAEPLSLENSSFSSDLERESARLHGAQVQETTSSTAMESTTTYVSRMLPQPHMQTMEPCQEDKTKVRCTTCNRHIENDKRKIQKHWRHHQKTILCAYTFCNYGVGGEPKTFSSRKEMHRHVWTSHAPWARQVNGEFPGTIPVLVRQCPVCGYIFQRSDNLTRHLKRGICVKKMQAEETERLVDESIWALLNA
ncbi:hypothetical protein CFIMG_002088RA [Ceratocystis fimbriata CBS 114723]|uniref:Uncharacterized protein n=1 Tax=Ceratocystis fimbriata CBS 114723 TaxID=1035309 RepID=A0A2C5XA78_9PEZI|nr:hypothetical protein CFIMG_002088RA [Ceratocystis fimbriata CBS 114723]